MLNGDLMSINYRRDIINVRDFLEIERAKKAKAPKSEIYLQNIFGFGI